MDVVYNFLTNLDTLGVENFYILIRFFQYCGLKIVKNKNDLVGDDSVCEMKIFKELKEHKDTKIRFAFKCFDLLLNL